MNRRSDDPLRAAINFIESLHLSRPQPHVVIDHVLSQLLDLTDARYGYAYLCDNAHASQVSWSLESVYQRDEQGNKTALEAFSASHQVPVQWLPKLLSGRCIFGEHMQDNAVNTLPREHPEITNHIVVPFHDARTVHGVVILCNAATQHDSIFDMRIRPYIAAVNCVFRTAQSSKVSDSQREWLDIIQDNHSIEFLLSFLDAMFNAVVLASPAGEILVCNKAAADLLGHSMREVSGNHISDYIPQGLPKLRPPRAPEQVMAAPYVSPSGTYRGLSVYNSQNEKLFVDLRMFHLIDGDKGYLGLVLDDVSDSLALNEDYQSSSQRFSVLTNLAPVAILQINNEWKCTYVNNTWCDYTHISQEESLGAGWLQGLHPEDSERVLHDLRSTVVRSGRYENEFRLITPLGKITWVKVNACGLYESTGETIGIIITLHDITEQREATERLKELAEKDQLTGLVNRTFFMDRLEQALRGVERFGPVALLYIDLDNFKHVNDSFGHDAGDYLLQVVADRLHKEIRDVDTMARIGGDEFNILLSNVTEGAAIRAIADKLLGALAPPVEIKKRSLYVSCSIGIAVADTAGIDASQLQKQADVALYRSKQGGRNQYKFYTQDLEQDANLHILLRESLRNKTRGDFFVVYQPQYDMATGDVMGIEALARWQHPDSGMVGPSKFIKMIEDSGLISEFNEWLFAEVCTHIRHWLDSHKHRISIPKISINLSAKQFRDRMLAQHIYSTVTQYGIDPRYITLELTETALVDDSVIAKDILKKLSGFGFKLALDDFGTGYSSLAYLRDMPFDALKIDQSFIKNVLHDEDNSKIVCAIMSLAEALKLEIIAEGVESSDVSHWLIERHCTLQQGFHFSKPLSRMDVEQLLKLRPDKDNVVPLIH